MSNYFTPQKQGMDMQNKDDQPFFNTDFMNTTNSSHSNSNKKKNGNNNNNGNNIQMINKSYSSKSGNNNQQIQQNAPQYQDQANTTFDSTDITYSSIASEPLSNLIQYPQIEHLDLTQFKVKMCPIKTQHSHRQCPFYHNPKDRKRPGYFYSADLCEYVERNEICPHGDKCMKAHSRVEQLYRPEKYKTKFCTFYPHNLEKCEYGSFCSFAHSEIDIVIDLIHNYDYDDDFYMFHYKTIWCPFNLTQHDKALCVYAHNWQDYRRKPHHHNYDPSPCQNWKSTDFIVNYEDGCPYKDNCNKCHGWKELEYHPLNYKTKSCPNKNCMKGKDCPHFHNQKERRAVSQNVGNGIFKFAPRNRVLTGTFKVRSNPMFLYPSNGSQNQFDNGLDPQMMFSNMYMTPPKTNYLSSYYDQAQTQKPDNFRPRRASYEIKMDQAQQNAQSPQPDPNSNTEVKPEKEFRKRIWSTGQRNNKKIEQNTESDKMFRDIVMQSMKRGSQTKADFMKGHNEIEELQFDENDVQNNLMLEKILDCEDDQANF